MFTTTHRSFAMKTTYWALALALVLSAIGFQAAPALAAGSNQVENCARWHTVQRGEYLTMIARMYDTTWREIAEINDLENPSVIYSGNRLCVALEGDDRTPQIPNTGSFEDAEFEVIAVDGGRAVTIEGDEFPRDTRIDVFMGEAGTRGEDGVRIDRFNTGDGDFVRTFEIPESLDDEDRIVIRLESVDTSFFMFDTFRNQDFGDIPDEDDDRDDDRDDDDDIDYDPVFIPEDDRDDILTSETRLNFGENSDVYLGLGGVFLPSSGYSGEMEMRRINPRYTDPELDLEFAQNLLEYRVRDQSNRAYERVFGLNYVYFNLNDDTFDAWQDDELNIYFYDVDRGRWTPCEIQLHIATVNRPHGRLACIAEDFGFYGLAYED